MATDIAPDVLMKRLQEYLKLWQRYIELFDKGVKSDNNTDDDERKFRNLQVELTKRAQFLTIAVPDNIFNKWKDIKKLLKDTPTLAILQKEVPIQLYTFRQLWHDVSITLNQRQGQLRNVLQEIEDNKGRKKKR